MKVPVFARKSSKTTFFVEREFGIERAIADMLNSTTELIWEDDPDGIKIKYIYDNLVWSPKRRLRTEKQEKQLRRINY